MSGPLFSATNNHIEKCGTPPFIDANEFKYAAYFCNSDREQWVLTVAKDNDQICLRGGDCGWDVEFQVVPHPLDANLPYVQDLVLEVAEYAWLLGCWLAFNYHTRNVDSRVFNSSILAVMSLGLGDFQKH